VCRALRRYTKEQGTPPPRTKWTRRVHHPVLSGHAAWAGGRPAQRTNAGPHSFSSQRRHALSAAATPPESFLEPLALLRSPRRRDHRHLRETGFFSARAEPWERALGTQREEAAPLVAEHLHIGVSD